MTHKATERYFRSRVEGTESTQMALRVKLAPFDETYEIEGEHPAHALEKLLSEIEWGILDSDYEFTITFIPEDEGDGDS